VKILATETVLVQQERDILVARQRVTEMARKLGLGVVDQTKVTTAASELTRNIIKYAKQGEVLIEEVEESGRKGLRVTFKDNGPGIVDLESAMKEGFTTGKGLGLGLPGSKRLVNEFEITSSAGCGTTVTIIKWKLN
jgi:serine/threonine-protein kinase RsbT